MAPTVQEIKTHIGIHLNHYKKSQLVVCDDLVAYEKSEKDQQEILDFAIK